VPLLARAAAGGDGVIVSIPSNCRVNGASFVGSLLAAYLAGLPLSADHLAEVVDTLALIGLRLASGSDRRGDLADELLVDADDRKWVGFSTSKLMPAGGTISIGWL